jgi:hypothetical protein
MLDEQYMLRMIYVYLLTYGGRYVRRYGRVMCCDNGVMTGSGWAEWLDDWVI